MESDTNERTKFRYYNIEIEKKLREIYLRMQRSLPRISNIDITLINSSIDEVMPILSFEAFIYKTSKAMITACTFILRLGEVLIEIINKIGDNEKNSIIYSAIIFILQRREFDVQTFKISGDQNLKIRCSGEIYNLMKLYRLLLLRSIKFSIEKLQLARTSFATSSFALSTLSMGYYFVNAINSKVVNGIWPQEKELDLFLKFPEVREIINNMMIDCKYINSVEEYRTQQVFYHMKWALNECPKSSEIIDIETFISSSSFWPSKLGDIFTQYRMTSEIVNLAVYFIQMNIQWQFVPGYYQLISPFLIQMQKEAPYFSKNTISLSKTLLANLQILNAFLEITLKSTNVYEVHGTTYTLARMNEWFAVSRYKHYLIRFPDYINFSIIADALRILFESEHYSILSSTLSFLYKNFSSFPEKYRSELIHNLFLPNFNRIFLHWNRDVRMTFMHLLVFLVARKEDIGGPTSAVREFGKPEILKRSVVRDEKYESLIIDKLSILKDQIRKSKKFSSHPKAKIQLSIEDYRGVLQCFENWQQTTNEHGEIEYPPVQSTSLPEG